MEHSESYMGHEAEEEADFHLSDYLQVVNKHRWLIAGCVLLVAGITAWLTFTAQPIYQATATMVIDKDPPLSPLQDDSAGLGGPASQAMTIKTHANLITTRPVVERVIRALNFEAAERKGTLEVHPVRTMIQPYLENLRTLVGREKDAPAPEPSPEQKRLALIQRVREKIAVSEVRDTRLLQVSVEDQSPERARDIANALVTSYIRFSLENRTESSQNNLRWLTSQLYDVQKKMEDAEAEFIAFKKDRQVFSVEGRQELINQKISEINGRYLGTRNDRLEIQARLDKLGNVRTGRRSDVLRVRSLVPNVLIDDLYAQLLEAELEQGRLAKTFKEKHPRMVGAKARIEDIRSKLSAEITKELESMRSRMAILKDREDKLQAVLKDFENEAMANNQQELEYSIYERNVETNRNLYDALLAKIKEADLTEKIETSGIRLTESAIVPGAPMRPNKKLNLALGLILGAMAGVGLAFLREYMDQTIRTDEDVSRHLGLPVLSVIPEAEKA
ncbi:MAG: GumC family protein [Desulfococcaceae bacterium]